MVSVSVDRLFEAGTHYAKRKSHRHPSMKPYVVGSKAGVEIFDLSITSTQLIKAKDALTALGAAGKTVLFVGGKREISDIVKQIAQGIRQPFVAGRWLGGTISNFVEIKKSKLGNHVAAAHLVYLGNATIGNNVNVGCGVITANYDGVNKYETEIGNDVFIGSNSNLIAPVNIEDGAMIAAGTTVTSDIDREKFVISRVPQKIKDRVR